MPVRPISNQQTVGRVVGGTTRDVQPGSIISLNLNKCQVIASPCKKVALTFANPTARVPYEIAEESLQALKLAVAQDLIVVSETPIVREPKKHAIKPFLDMVDAANHKNDLRDVLIRIVRTVRNIDGLNAYQVMERMVMHESENRCRPEIINVIGDFMENLVGGPMGVEEHPQDAEQIVIDPTRSVQKVSGGAFDRSNEQEERLKELI